MVLPHVFSNGGFEVMVALNRSITVGKGDMLSKYSMAIYGDFDHLTQFKRKIGGVYCEIKYPYSIGVGETIYHPGALPGEEDPYLPAMQAQHIKTFLQWIKDKCVASGWYVEDTGGGDLSGFFVTGEYQPITFVQAATQVEIEMEAVAFGVEFGLVDFLPFGGSMSAPLVPSPGLVMKSPYKSCLTANDFRNGIAVFEFGANWWFVIGGGNVELVMFGILMPPDQFIGSLKSFFRHGNREALESLMLKASPGGVMFLPGATLGIPGLSLSYRAGLMYDRRYLGKLASEVFN
jgi:hypothetical protein